MDVMFVEHTEAGLAGYVMRTQASRVSRLGFRVQRRAQRVDRVNHPLPSCYKAS